METLELSYVAYETIKWYSRFGQWAVPYKEKHVSIL